MKMFSKVAFGAVLATGMMSVVAAPPALAAKKKEVKSDQLKLSPDVLPLAQAAQTALTAKDAAAAETAIAGIEAAAKTDDDRYIGAAARINLISMKIVAAQAANQPFDEAALKGPLDTLLSNPRTPPADLPRYAYQRGVIAFNSKAYPEALTYLQRARDGGYANPDLGLQIVKTRIEMGDAAEGSVELERYIAAQTQAGQKADETLYRYAIAKTNQKKLTPQAIAWSRRYVAAYPTPKNWRDAIITYGMTQNSIVPTLDKGQKVDLFRLLRATNALADQYDYENYAQWTFDLGLPYETKAVITEGRASGKIPASSASATALLASANAGIRTEGSLAPLDTRARAAANGKLAAGTADAYLGNGDYAKAIELYRVALQKGSVDNDAVNTHLGIALARSGDKAGAKTAFDAVTGAPRKDIAGFWTSYLEAQPAS